MLRCKTNATMAGSMQSQYKEQHLHGVGIGCELDIAGFAA